MCVVGGGQYLTSTGQRVAINGDTRQRIHAIGITEKQKAIVRNVDFIGGRIPGTRQVRRQMNHFIFSSKIVYGLPIFGTLTPSERHNGLALRLTRYRRRDPTVESLAKNLHGVEISDIIGPDAPSLEKETAEVDIPEYEARKLLLARDPLCAVDAFSINIRVLLASLLGLRMCPDCPRCAQSSSPCTDIVGSNAEPMGVSLGAPTP